MIRETLLILVVIVVTFAATQILAKCNDSSGLIFCQSDLFRHAIRFAPSRWCGSLAMLGLAKTLLFLPGDPENQDITTRQSFFRGAAL